MKGLTINKFVKTYWNDAKTKKFVELGQMNLYKKHAICLKLLYNLQGYCNTITIPVSFYYPSLYLIIMFQLTRAFTRDYYA